MTSAIKHASDIIVGFAGMTHLGIVSATSVAAKGFKTIGYDSDSQLIERLSAGQPPIEEPDLDDLLRANGARQAFTNDLSRLAECDIVYISYDVPTDDRGQSDLRPIVGIIEAVAKALRPDGILVILCQVPPGFTRGVRAVPPERLYYQVETLVFGRAMARALHPERTIIGCADSSAPLEPRYEALLSAFGCPLIPMSYESAELCKIAINCCLVSSISVANTLAELCENIGAEWSEIVPALKLDARIGPSAYLSPGLGIAGGNLERDLATVIALSERFETDAGIVRAWIDNSRRRRDWVRRTIKTALLREKPEATIAVWGLAYKENTHSIKNSPSVATIMGLPETRFFAHDPVVQASAISHARLTGVDSPLAALEGADALMILTPWPAYRRVGVEEIARTMRGRIVIDPYRLLDPRAAAAAGLDYYTLGARHNPSAGIL
ncbi:UDP-glucose/GDP-mannose dehydrogenase family protein [Methylocystis sp. H4A]|uniref:nucleotide sugar dehydrogenase n=1 Tax=Methylocystis sp. H4A TaxID=2785788 RepID=UPI0018C2318E|nr:nucleotide sugar dehydrogenase [Methylocystis sp. H4A]MBG0800310.1 UDP-glucose/GDP-mannose dehydrogenase family protein [Methylocystis sp. H4A]